MIFLCLWLIIMCCYFHYDLAQYFIICICLFVHLSHFSAIYSVCFPKLPNYIRLFLCQFFFLISSFILDELCFKRGEQCVPSLFLFMYVRLLHFLHVSVCKSISRYSNNFYYYMFIVIE
uniref:Uncharacterized protein n=1 Tax=Parascaris univalens TaxID=6257 RepID=A0A915ANG6_PARUN